MFMFVVPVMLDNHIVDKKALKKLEEIDYRLVFDTLLIGVNLISTDCINDIAVFVTSLSHEKLMILTFDDVVKAVGEYEDKSGGLV